MNAMRRNMLKGAGGLGVLSIAVTAGLLKPTRVLAEWNQAGFGATKVADALAAIGASGAAESRDIVIMAPDIAENGAAVPVQILVSLSDVESVAILGEKNTYPLVGQYALTDFDGFLSTRIKMGATSNVLAVVKAGGKFYTAAKKVVVTVGGCSS
jgi:sulfur-oxidizing protein SoxY